ncbi:MAG: glycogen synthase GlgA [Panacagrimonas sp.]
MRLLFAAGEALPFSKTGGLADVAFALPAALARQGVDLRVVTPAYRGALEKLQSPRRVAQLDIRGQSFTIWEGRVEPGGFLAWLVDCPPLYPRAGTPYADALGHEYGDNPWRFGCFSEAIAQLALGAAETGWQPQVVHLNDWHTGLVPVWLGPPQTRPRLMFTIHNLAYQGLFSRDDFDALGLRPELWRPDALEFHGGFSFMKSALLQADAITTVSPTYAREIQTPAFGERLDGVIRSRASVLHGIANGIDTDTWNPATDPYLYTRYDRDTVVEGKRANKLALQAALGLEPAIDAPLLGFIGRLAYQKGADLLSSAGGWMEQQRVQLALLGSGDKGLEQAFAQMAQRAPGRVAVHLGHDEKLAHIIEAGADFLVMPSRYEPCGLNQMYSQRYGTIPVVRKTGGLADTVVDADAESIATGRATGIVFEHADVGGITYGLGHALHLFRQPETWRRIQNAGMARDFSWAAAARSYLDLYSEVLK